MPTESSFTDTCYDEEDPGTPYAGEPIAGVMASVIDPGPVDLCIVTASETTE